MKRIISVFLAVCIVLMLIPTAFAENTVEEIQPEMATQREVLELKQYIEGSICQMFYVNWWYFDMISEYTLAYIDADGAKDDEFIPLFDEIFELRDSSREDDSDITKVQLNDYYEKIDVIARTYTLKKVELEYLLYCCEGEQNIKSYYPDDLWKDFVEKRTAAEAVYKDETVNDIRVSDAYWELKFAYDALCASNPTAGDLDFNGEADIIDATLIQRYCAKMISLNSSQMMVARITGSEVDITDATQVQRYLAKMMPTLHASYLDALINSPWKGRVGFENDIFIGNRVIYMRPNQGQYYSN